MTLIWRVSKAGCSGRFDEAVEERNNRNFANNSPEMDNVFTP